jgi:sterol 3beta-glucosyltransferase
MRDILAACTGSDAVIALAVIQDLALIAAEKLGLPLMFVHLVPLCRTTAFPSPLVTVANLPLPVMNAWSHDLFNLAWWHGTRRDVNELRRNLGVRAISETANTRCRTLKTPILQVFSPNVLPRPRDWGPEHLVTGFWRLPDDVKAGLGELDPPAGLAEWLAAGPPPVYVGLGSMPVRDPNAMMALVASVTETLGVRAVIGAGWPVPETTAAARQSAPVFVVNGVNHDWLFPHCSAIVHHGGVGTTAASLQSGVPTLVCAVFSDQPFWGKRVASLGVGAWMPYATLTHATLLRGLRHLQDNALKKRAVALGETLRKEDGLGLAVDAVHRHLAGAPVPR